MLLEVGVGFTLLISSKFTGGLGGEEEEDEELLFHDAAAEQQQGEGEEDEDEGEWGEGDEADGGLGGEAEAAGGAVDPHASPDGKWAAFVRRGELFVVPLTEQPRSPRCQEKVGSGG